MEAFTAEAAFMATAAGKAFFALMEPHRLMFLGLGGTTAASSSCPASAA